MNKLITEMNQLEFSTWLAVRRQPRDIKQPKAKTPSVKDLALAWSIPENQLIEMIELYRKENNV